jgi:hypothetical protein
MTRYDLRRALIGARDRMLLAMYDMAHLTLARFSRFIPELLYQRLEHAILRRELQLLALPPHWVAEGPDGFQPESVFDIVLGRGAPNPERIGCCSEAELIEFANRRRPVDDPGFHHIMNCSPCYRRLRTLQRLKVH